jgi:dCTP deaminase
MILSNVEIHKAIDAGDIIITPDPTPRLPSLQNPKSPYDTTAVNLRLSNALSVCKDNPAAFDLRKSGIPQYLKDNYIQKTIDPDGGYTLQPNQLALGNTMETIELPINLGHKVYAARVEGRSSNARCGLLVHFTAPTIHAGFKGTITLEIINLGKMGIVLYPELEICQLIFEVVEGIPVRHDSQFQNQTTPAGTRK